MKNDISSISNYMLIVEYSLRKNNNFYLFRVFLFGNLLVEFAELF